MWLNNGGENALFVDTLKAVKPLNFTNCPFAFV
jgi:hypothetical protein